MANTSVISAVSESAFKALDRTLSHETHRDEIILYKVYLRKKWYGYLSAQQSSLYSAEIKRRKDVFKKAFDSREMQNFFEDKLRQLQRAMDFTPTDSRVQSGQALYQADLRGSIKSLTGDSVTTEEYIDVTPFVTSLSWDNSVTTTQSGFSCYLSNPGHVLYDNIGRLLIEARDELFFFIWDSVWEKYVPVSAGVVTAVDDSYDSGAYGVSVNGMTVFLYLQQSNVNIQPSLSNLNNMFEWNPSVAVKARRHGVETFTYEDFLNRNDVKQLKDPSAYTNIFTGMDIASIASMLICGVKTYVARFVASRVFVKKGESLDGILAAKGYTKDEVYAITHDASGISRGYRRNSKGLAVMDYEVVIPPNKSLSNASLETLKTVAGITSTKVYKLTEAMTLSTIAAKNGVTTTQVRLLNPGLNFTKAIAKNTSVTIPVSFNEASSRGLGFELQSSVGTSYVPRNSSNILRAQYDLSSKMKSISWSDWFKQVEAPPGPTGNFSNSLIVEEDVEHDIGYQMIFANDIPMFEATYANRAKLIQELADRTGLFFWVDPSGNFRLETVHANDFPSVVIEDLDIKSWSFSENSDEVVTRVDVLGENRYGIPINEGDFKPQMAMSVDWDVFTRYGYLVDSPQSLPQFKDDSSQAGGELEKGTAACVAYSRRFLSMRNSAVLSGDLTTTIKPDIRPNTTVYVRKRNMIYLVTGVRGSMSTSGACNVVLSLAYGRLPGQFFKGLLYEYDERIAGNGPRQRDLLTFLAKQREMELSMFLANRGPAYDYVKNVVEQDEIDFAVDLLVNGPKGKIYNDKREVVANYMYLASASNYLRSRKMGSVYSKKLVTA